MTDDSGSEEKFAMPAALANYWLYGEGAVKIRWGTPGDLTRCNRYIRKYVSPGQGWSTCQNLHKRRFGYPNPRD